MKIFFIFLLILFTVISCKTETKDVKPTVETVKQNLPPIPKSIILFGEKVSLEDEDIRERLDREIMANAYFHSQTILNMKRAARYFPVIEPILKEQNLPNDFKYLPIIESNLANVTSPAGAKGYWQFMPETGKHFGLKQDWWQDNRRGITAATDAALTYLQRLHGMFGDWQLALAAYNWGEGSVMRAIARAKAAGRPINYNGLSAYMPAETRNYYPKLLVLS
jgi:soluble lytic murein transglycosylase-like protein